jgi:hypothetical protein
MQIDVNNSVAIHRFLALAEDNGWKWVAFDRPANGQIDQFYGFESAGEVNLFCENGNMDFNVDEQNFVVADYGYMAIPTLRQAIEPVMKTEIPGVSSDRLMAQLTAQEVQLLVGQDRETLISAIRSGAVFRYNLTG